MSSSSFNNLIVSLTELGERRGQREKAAAKIIKDALSIEQIDYITQSFLAKIPNTINASLTADGKAIPCLGSSLVSGEIDNKACISSSFGKINDKQAIVFNPVSLGLCLQSYKSIPALAISRDSVVDLIMANKISGVVEVKAEAFESQNILVGNLKNPKAIIFAHYDSIVGSGAVDNAGSVQVIFDALTQNRSLIKNNLFVFAGCEEESISSIDGGYGFQVFDLKYKDLMNSAKEIIVIDGVGIGSPSLVNHHQDWVLPIKRIYQIDKKVFWMQNNQSLVMKYYHTVLDTLDNLDTRFIGEATELLLSRIDDI